ncbi:hypothetical protein LWC34_05390 [Kibdelosporangium philippinense]|uniref:Uncharacterized protein n=1 Tax=Kibdelosporangium philippinense TaxID=211113 RepID=A0ABS8Z2V5_9PSEU|nr:hypothetical protein [Kibdelosporangium philippinense]MCE7002264.1 hypothetical protein [Kibdelosporangium philippinense]
MSYFDIQGHQPQWLNGLSAIAVAHGPRLHSMVGRHLSHAWLLWDLDADEWIADGPVLLDFDHEQVEINHQKFDDLSITWNTVDPEGQPAWTYGDWGHPDDRASQLAWRHDAQAELAALQGQRLQAVDLLEYVGGDMADGMVAVSFAFADGQVTISNGLDENSLEFSDPDSRYLHWSKM